METKTKAGIAGGIGGVAALIIASVFHLEGGYVNNPADPGGATNFGVTESVARSHGYTDAMQLLPKELATEIYYKDYIVKPGFLPLVQIQPAVAEELVDTGVNAGPARAARWFQMSLNSLNRGGKDYPQINVDGRIGPGSIAAYQSLEKVRGKVGACELMIKLLDAHQAQHYISLTNMPTFTPGWVAHRIGNVPLSKCKFYGITNASDTVR